MNERHLRLSKLWTFCAFVGAIIGYFREPSLSGAIAGGILFLVACGTVSVLMTTPNSSAS
jgi:uncharacterized membrane protein (UPF0136 family)